MPFTAADLAAIDAALATGELVVRQGDRQVQYRSVAELQAAREVIRAEQRTTRPARQFRVGVSKGL